MLALSLMVSDSLGATLTVQRETFPLGDPVRMYQTGSSVARGPEGTDEESTQLICCLFTSRQEKDERKQRASEDRRSRGHGTRGSLLDRTSWDLLSVPPPTSLKRSGARALHNNIFFREWEAVLFAILFIKGSHLEYENAFAITQIKVKVFFLSIIDVMATQTAKETSLIGNELKNTEYVLNYSPFRCW